MSLSVYRAKRNFDATNEPVGSKKKKPAASSARKSAVSPENKKIYVIQFHRARRGHYDLRLEYGGALLSWAVPKCPAQEGKRLAVRVEDHPLDYASFEGEIPKGQYGAGTVEIWDKGYYVPDASFKEGLKNGSLKFTLYGEKLKGKWALVRMNDEKNWLLLKEKDGAKAANMPNPFGECKVKRAKAASAIPSDKDYIYELKYDGYRITAYVEGGKARLMTRGGKDMSDKFPNVSDALIRLTAGRSAVFDGEAVVVKDGKTDFGALNHTKGEEVDYVIFDLLAEGGEDLRATPLNRRKQKLKNLLKNAPPVLFYSEDFTDGEALFESAKDVGAEGIVCKRASASYFEDDWLKIKCRHRQEFVILGYTSGEKEISSLLLGFYDDGKLTYAGKVGTGLGAKNTAMLKQLFGQLSSDVELVPGKKNVHWLKPELMAEVEFAEWTSAGLLRQPSFKGVRDDKSALSVRNEDPTAKKGITITNPDKIVFTHPKVTKGDVANYYDRAAPLMLPFLKDRPVTVVRCNNGIEKKFFKKHPRSDKDKLIYIESEADIMREVQAGTVEFHMQCYSETAPIFVFDLDPDENLPLDAVRRGARDLKKTLDELGLKSFLKLSGGKGYHILINAEPMPKEDFTSFARSVAELMAEKYPARYTANIKKEKRHGKIFIDWQRNTPSATAVAPYSLRAREGATVSAPVPWSKLNEYAPDQFDIFSFFASKGRNGLPED